MRHSLGHELKRAYRKLYIAAARRVPFYLEKRKAVAVAGRLRNKMGGLEATNLKLTEALTTTQTELTEAERLVPIMLDKNKQLKAQDRRIGRLDEEVIRASQQSYTEGLRRNPGKEAYLFVDNLGKILYQSPAAVKLLGAQQSLRDIIYARRIEEAGREPLSRSQRKDHIISDVTHTHYNPDSRNQSGVLLVKRGRNPTYPLEITNEDVIIDRGVKTGIIINIKACGRRSIGKKDVGTTAFFQQETVTKIKTTGLSPETT